MSMQGGVSNPILLSFNVTASGELVEEVAGKKIRVLAMALGRAAGNARLASSGGAIICGPFAQTAVLPFMASGWCETVAGEALNIALSGSDSTGGSITYILV